MDRMRKESRGKNQDCKSQDAGIKKQERQLQNLNNKCPDSYSLAS